jgi:hypothetical protein
MPSTDRIELLIQAGVASSREAFSHEALHVIQKLSDEEFNGLLTMRQKIYQNNHDHGERCDHFICECI